MSERFLKQIISQRSDWLLKKHPLAFLLLTSIARQARRYSGHQDGLEVGECFSSHKDCGLSRQKWRTAKEKLKKHGFIEEVHNSKRFLDETKCTLRATIEPTIKCTLLKIIDLSVYDINSEMINQGINQGINQASTKHQPQTRKNKKEQEQSIYIPNKHASAQNSDPKVESLMSLKEKDCFFVKSTKNAPHKVSKMKVHEEASKLGFFPEEIDKAIQKANDSDRKIVDPIKYILGILNNKPKEKNELKQGKSGDGRTGREGWEKLFEGNSEILPKGSEQRIS